MSAIEQRARMLLALALRKMGQPEHAYHVGVGGDLEADDQALIQALIAALTPPEGFVLVPVDATDEMLEAAGRVVFREAGQQWDATLGIPERWVIDVQRQCHEAMLAARREVP